MERWRPIWHNCMETIPGARGEALASWGVGIQCKCPDSR